MQRSSSVRDRARRPPSIARWGAAIAAVLAGDATAQTTAPIDDAFAPVGSVVATYVPPQAPGDPFRLWIDAQAGAFAALLITRVAPGSTVQPYLTVGELATATVFPVALDGNGDLDLSIASPPDVSLESIYEAGLRFRIVFGVPGVAQPLVSDPIQVIASAPTSLDPTMPDAAAGATGPTSVGGVSSIDGTSSPTPGVTSTASTTPSTALTPSSLTSSQSSTTTSSTTTSSTSLGAPAPAANELDSGSAPPNPTASKSGISPTSSYSVPVPTNLPIRLSTQFTFLSATHDQPSPIQGSGH